MKIVSVVGARPQFIKAATVSRHLRRAHQEVLVHTGQHYDFELSAAFFEELALPAPAANLGVGSKAAAVQIGEMAAKLGELIAREEPAAVVVPGDTNSTLAGAIAASCAGVPLAHVEAGMRSYDWAMPEERNRVLTDRLADLKLCPHADAAAALAAEGLGEGVVVTGDVMYEVAAAAYDKLDVATYLTPLGLEPGAYVYATCHRQENTDEPARLAAIVAALNGLPLPVFFPAHPRTAAALAAAGLDDPGDAGNVRLAPPTTYYRSLALVKHAAAVVTDSGGVQREAYLYGVPAVTLRARTEWPETVAAGANELADANAARIGAAVARALARRERRPRLELVGVPEPSERIAQALSDLLLRGLV